MSVRLVLAPTAGVVGAGLMVVEVVEEVVVAGVVDEVEDEVEDMVVVVEKAEDTNCRSHLYFCC